MRILFVSDSYYPHINGVYYFVCRIGPMLQERGHHVAVIAPSATRAASFSKIDGLDVYGIPSLSTIFYPSVRIPLPFLLKRRIKKIIKKFNPDIIHLQDHFPISKGSSCSRPTREQCRSARSAVSWKSCAVSDRMRDISATRVEYCR